MKNNFLKKSLILLLATTFALTFVSCSSEKVLSDIGSKIESEITDIALPSDTGSEELEESPDTANYSGLKISFIDVGQADCALIQVNKKNYLVDAGNVEDAKTVIDYLKDHNVETIDGLIYTHPHEDHLGSDSIVKSFNVKSAFLSSLKSNSTCYNRIMTALAKKGVDIKYPVPGDTIKCGNATFKFIGPISSKDDANNMSLVFKLVYEKTSFLFMGDAETFEEKEILYSDNNISADVLKVGHHGSGTASSYSFLREANPKYAVISCGEGNTYGHPHDEALSRLNSIGANIYRTDELGTIICKSDGKNITFNKTGEVSTHEHSDGDGLGQIDKTSDSSYKYIGNINSKIAHTTECSSLPSEKNRIYFNTLKEVKDAGYKLCERCN